MRDALVAGITLNIFNKHCDRVKLACIAQMINVLQSVILTDGGKMLKTPTYHVMHMFRHHQGGELLGSSLCGTGTVGEGENAVPEITESVSEKDGVITITLNNLSNKDTKDLEILFTGDTAKTVAEAHIVASGDFHDYNSFEEPEKVKEEEFSGVSADGRALKVSLPAASVVEIRVR